MEHQNSQTCSLSAKAAMASEQAVSCSFSMEHPSTNLKLLLHHLIRDRLSLLTCFKADNLFAAGKTRQKRTVSSPVPAATKHIHLATLVLGCQRKVTEILHRPNTLHKKHKLCTLETGHTVKRQMSTCTSCSCLSIWRHGKE